MNLEYKTYQVYDYIVKNILPIYKNEALANKRPITVVTFGIKSNIPNATFNININGVSVKVDTLEFIEALNSIPALINLAKSSRVLIAYFDTLQLDSFLNIVNEEQERVCI